MNTFHYLHRRAVLAALFASSATGVLSSFPAKAQGDPLSSWNEGTAKQSILDFVTAISRAGSPDFVPVPQTYCYIRQ